MILRDNWLATRRYLVYCVDVEQNAPATASTKRSQLRHLLEWAGETAFADVPDKRPTFPKYLTTARNSNKPGTTTQETVHRICWTTRAFLRWLRSENPKQYPKLTEAWLKGIEAPKMAGDVKAREVYSLEDVLRIVRVTGGTLYDVRARAAVAFLFLSGMRAGAFVTVPIKAVDLDTRTVKQFPSMGVRTKNTKAALTYLLPIPELLDVVKEWDSLVRSSLPVSEPWFASMDHDSSRVTLTLSKTFERSREHGLADSVRRACEGAGVKYLSSHKLRHGHAVYAIQQVATVADMKAVSQNLMHASMVTTESIYATLTGVQVSDRIAALGQGRSAGDGAQGSPKELTADDLRLLQKFQKFQEFLQNEGG
jgi:site-specific recombinase XerC